MTTNLAQETPVVAPATKTAASLWIDRIKAAREYWKEDFHRARKNMEFVGNLQWKSQQNPDSEKYIANQTLRMVSDKVATLYAKNPTAEAKRRPRLDFVIWDEKQETLQYAVQQLQSGVMNPAAQALVLDYLNGRNYRNLIDRIWKTLELLFSLQLDLQDYDFKKAMKQLVRRVIITGVGYVRINYERNYAPSISDPSNSITKRLREVSAIEQDRLEGKIAEDSEKNVELDQLTASALSDLEDQPEVAERLVFDFPPVTTIIIDPKCRQMKDFVGAQWIAQQYTMPLDEVNAFFELRGESAIKATTTPTYTTQHQRYDTYTSDNNPETSVACIDLYEVFDKKTKSTFFVVEGYPNWVQPPQPLDLKVRGFWPIQAISFNDLETETKDSDEMRITCWPPSDVFLWKHPQQELNKRRNAQSRHRAGASPKLAVSKNAHLTDADIAALKGIDPDEGVTVVQLEGIMPDQDINKVLMSVQHPPITMELYDTSQVELDMGKMVNVQSSDLGQQNPGETATGQSIAAQSKSVAAASNVDDIDDLLTWIARVGGEILLTQMPQNIVQLLVGPGAVWPQSETASFNSALYLTVKAASSGRPNQALHISHVRELFPIFMQLGARPEALVREGLRAFDEQLDPGDFFPLLPPDLGRPQIGLNQSQMAATPPTVDPSAPSIPGANAQPLPSLQFGASPVPTVVA